MDVFSCFLPSETSTPPPTSRIEAVTHLVSRGETLAAVAAKYHTTESLLFRLNHLHSSTLHPGQTLLVPKSGEGNAKSTTLDIFKAPVVYVATSTARYKGTLTVTPKKLIFEPLPSKDSSSHAISIRMEDIFDCQIVDDHAEEHLHDMLDTSAPHSYIQVGAIVMDHGKIFYFLLNKIKAAYLCKKIRHWIEECKNNILHTSIIVPAKSFETGSPKVFAPIKRTKSVEEELQNFDRCPTLTGKSKILTEKDLRKIAPFIPTRFQTSELFLAYSVSGHGTSIQTFYKNVKNLAPTIFIVEDTMHYVFGAYVSEPWAPGKRYYGTGESFLFKLSPELSVFKWTKKNNFFVLSSESSLALGGGGAGFGLWVDKDFFHGSSSPSDTFNNTCLASSEQFKIIDIEVWAFTGGK